MPPEVVTLLVAIFGALGVILGKIVEQWASRNKTDAEVAKSLRDGLYLEITRLQAETRDLRERCDRLEAEIGAERERSGTEREARHEAERLAAELAEKNNALEGRCAAMQQRIAALEREVADLRGAATRRLDEPMQR